MGVGQGVGSGRKGVVCGEEGSQWWWVKGGWGRQLCVQAGRWEKFLLVGRRLKVNGMLAHCHMSCLGNSRTCLLEKGEGRSW